MFVFIPGFISSVRFGPGGTDPAEIYKEEEKSKIASKMTSLSNMFYFRSENQKIG